MLWRKTKTRCDHEWFELEVSEEYVDRSTYGYIDGKWETIGHMYCPKCNTRKRVTEQECRLKMKAQEIKRNYKIQ